MRKIKISTDSTCDMSPELVARFGIRVMPLHITLGDETFDDDGVQITQEKLFEYTARSGELSKTSAVSIGEYLDAFGDMTADGSEVVHISFSSELSVCYANAKLAADEMNGVHVVDSKNLSTGTALVIMKACDLADAGLGGAEIAAELEKIVKCVDVSFVVDTLENLYKGGRCSAVSKLGANLLKLKPCIEVHGGKMGVYRKFRGSIASVIPEYIKSKIIDVDDIDTSRIFITHTCGEDESVLEPARELVRSLAPFEEIFDTKAGCTVSTHCGPYTLGVLFIRKTPIDK